MEWMHYKGRKIFLQVDTINGIRSYQGSVNDVVFMGKNSEGVEIYFIEIIDRYGMKIGFASNSIKLIQEER